MCSLFTSALEGWGKLQLVGYNAQQKLKLH